ncbi:hypothetical protein E2C01_091767 [Portunus trituberculatus]|uniref:Uncharacterized protein n=1 Tax=Portunus trituberculatus TaxID=210409 RepID=A0A5B7JVY5_PORTR|nr:hypothetical protein [Portunus trituberculatus]
MGLALRFINSVTSGSFVAAFHFAASFDCSDFGEAHFTSPPPSLVSRDFVSILFRFVCRDSVRLLCCLECSFFSTSISFLFTFFVWFVSRLSNLFSPCLLPFSNPFSSGIHFYLEIRIRLDLLIDVRKGPWRSED